MIVTLKPNTLVLVNKVVSADGLDVEALMKASIRPKIKSQMRTNSSVKRRHLKT
jgi:hypothetical protein